MTQTNKQDPLRDLLTRAKKRVKKALHIHRWCIAEIMPKHRKEYGSLLKFCGNGCSAKEIIHD